MKFRLALALLALASPAFAQSTPNLKTGTQFNGVTVKDTATKSQGTSVADPGTGNLEALLPVQTVTGASKTFASADLFKETRRSNSGSAMSDTFPGTGTTGLVNGARMFVNNVDATANLTITAGSGTTINGGASAVVGPTRSAYWVYDAPNTTWRTTGNSLSALLCSSAGVTGILKGNGLGACTAAVAGTDYLSPTSTLDATKLSGAAPVASLGTGAAAHSLLFDVAGVGTWKLVPDCQDSTGNHLNYTQSTDTVSCGTSVPANAVTGPASATNNDIATFNGTGGKIIQDSGKALPSGTVVGTSDVQTLTNKTLTSPAITTPSGIVKGDVGLGNVDNTSDATKNSATATLTNKTIDTAGPNTLKVGGVTLSTGQYPGTATNDNATAGNIGEFVSSSIAGGSAVALTSGTPANLTSISLTAGDWDVQCHSYYRTAATTAVKTLITNTNTTSAGLDNTTPGAFNQVTNNAYLTYNVADLAVVGPMRRFSLSATTTVYCVSYTDFNTSTLSVWGLLRARRMR